MVDVVMNGFRLLEPINLRTVCFATQHVPIAGPEVFLKPWVWVRFGVT